MSEVPLRLLYLPEREEALVEQLGDTESAQAIRADGPEATFGSARVQLVRCRSKWLLKRTGEVRAEYISETTGVRYTFIAQPERLHEFTFDQTVLVPTALVKVQTKSGLPLLVHRFDDLNAIKEGHRYWKSLWEDTYPEVLIRASCHHRFDGSFWGQIVVSDDAPRPA